MKTNFKILVLLTFSILLCFNSTRAQLKSDSFKSTVNFFPLSDVRLLASDFKHIQDLDHDYLLTFEPDRLLSWFRREAGLTPKAAPYPSWESEDIWGEGPLPGHIMGFYLSSMSMMYASTQDEKIIEKLNYTLQGLKECQEANRNGYLLATINGKRVFEEVVAGNFKTSNPLINHSWEPVYVLNKIMLGLYSVNQYCPLPLSKEILINVANWFGQEVLDKLSNEQIQELLVCEHGSINESFIQVYKLTGDKKYFNWASQLNDEDMLIPLSQKKDVLNGWHANTQIPKFTGFENLYLYNGDTTYTNASRFFWKTVVNKHTWINGGNSTGEHFFPESDFVNRVNRTGGPESCNSVNMMRLTEILYENYGEAEKIDYYEKILYNHILANYEPEQGMCAYFTSMRPGHYKAYGSPDKSFWCCTGTGLEAPAKFSKMIYAYQNRDLFVNLFIPSAVKWNQLGVELMQETNFPDKDATKFIVSVKNPTQFNLKIRHPYWVQEKGFIIKVNGKVQAIKSTIGSYASINRTWVNGDVITVEIPSQLYVEKLKGDETFLTVRYGPIVLGAKVDNHGLKKSDFWLGLKQDAEIEVPVTAAPPLFGAFESIEKNIEKENSAALSFKTNLNISGSPITLVPYNRIHFSRYELYFRHLPTVKEYSAELNQLLNDTLNHISLIQSTTDSVMLGNAESEKIHKIESVNSLVEKKGNIIWRSVNKGGYINFEMKSDPSKKQDLYLMFRSGLDKAGKFEILIDGQQVFIVDPSLKLSDENNLRIRIPQEAKSGKELITVKIHGLKNLGIAGLMDLRILNVEN